MVPSYGSNDPAARLKGYVHPKGLEGSLAHWNGTQLPAIHRSCGANLAL